MDTNETTAAAAEPAATQQALAPKEHLRYARAEDEERRIQKSWRAAHGQSQPARQHAASTASTAAERPIQANGAQVPEQVGQF